MAKGSDKNFRNAGTGRFVTKSAATKNPSGTLGEKRGGGSTNGAHRSAITGKFVGKAAAARWPNKTIRDS